MFDKKFDERFLSVRDSRFDAAHADVENKMLDQMAIERRKMKDAYRRSLLHPELNSGAKIPTEIPQETATAQVFYNGQITPNSAGRFILIIDPSIQNATLYNDETINGTGTAGSGTTISLAQDSTVIDMFRLVSSSVIITYSGALDKASGYIVGAVTSNLSNATNSTFFDFQNIENLQNKQVFNPVDGLKMIYSPYDTQQLEYQTITSYSGGTSSTKWKKLFVIYGEGLPATTCLRWDIVRNIEYVSKPGLREYIPHTLASPCDYDHSVIAEVKQNEVTIAPVKKPVEVFQSKTVPDFRSYNLPGLSPGFGLSPLGSLSVSNAIDLLGNLTSGNSKGLTGTLKDLRDTYSSFGLKY